MSQLKFNHLFAGLMGLSILTGFILPQRRANQLHPEIQAIFAPVSAPVGAIGRFFHNRVAPDLTSDKRPSEAIVAENTSLEVENARLNAQLKTFRELDRERAKMGSLKDRCSVFSVIGADPGPRESLLIGGSSLEGLRNGMAVLYGEGNIAGLIARAGVGGAQVQLITDVGFRARADIMRMTMVDNRPVVSAVAASEFLAIGIGKNRMVIRNMPYDQARAVKVGDLVFADEPDWPAEVKGRYLGHVISVGKLASAPQYADIRIEPRENLLRLRTLMVLTREK